MRKTAALLFLLVGAAGPQDPPKSEPLSRERVRQLLEQLAHDDAPRREEATQALRSAGETVRKDLEEAARSTNPERAGRARRLLWALDRLRLVIKVENAGGIPKGKPIPAVLTIRNLSRDSEVYFEEGFKFAVWLLELAEEPPQEGRRYRGGGSSRVSTGCVLSESDFVQIAPDGERAIRTEDLRQHGKFMISDDVVKKYPKISLLSPTLAGKYKLVATYAYDREKYVSNCGKGCAHHANPETAWNRCLDTPFQVEAEFVIK